MALFIIFKTSRETEPVILGILQTNYPMKATHEAAVSQYLAAYQHQCKKTETDESMAGLLEYASKQGLEWKEAEYGSFYL